MHHSHNELTQVELSDDLSNLKLQYKDLVLPEHPLKSERYISDLHFYKEGTFNHRLLNTNKEEKAIKVTTQDYFPKYLRPYLHQLRVAVRDTETDNVVDYHIDKA